MRTFSVSAELALPAHVFFLERDSAAFRSLVAKMLDLGSLEFEDEWQENGVSYVKQTTYPQFDKYVPASVAKMAQKYIGPKVVYTDILAYDPKKLQQSPFIIEVDSIPPVFKDKTHLKSRLIIEEVDKHTCRQTLEGTLDVHVGIGLGRMVEPIIAQQLAKVYRSIPQVVNKWKKIRQELTATPQGREMLLSGRPNLDLQWISDETKEYLQGDALLPAMDRRTPLGSAASSPAQRSRKLDTYTKSTRNLLAKAQAQLAKEQQGAHHNIGASTAGTAHGRAGSPPAAGRLGPAELPGQAGSERAASLEGGASATLEGSVASSQQLSPPGSFTRPERASSAELAAAIEPEPFDPEAVMYGAYVDEGLQASSEAADDKLGIEAPTEVPAKEVGGPAADAPAGVGKKTRRPKRRRRQENFNESFRHWSSVWSKMGIRGERSGPDTPQQRPSAFMRVMTCGAAKPAPIED